MSRHKSLPATGYAVLGLLSFGRELSGYELKKWADTILALFYWSPAVSQVYGELKRLEAMGYVTSREVAQDEARTKRVYRITDDGLAALRAWVLRDAVEPPVLKHSTILRVWLGHLGDPATMADLVRRHLELTQVQLEHAHRTVEGAERMEFGEYPRLVARWSVRYHEAEIELGRQLLAMIEALPAEATGERNRPVPRRVSGQSEDGG